MLFLFRYDLLKLCNEGPQKKLNETIYCQPAIMVTSLAALELLRRHREDGISKCIGTAGFSLGEITSLVFAGALPFDEGKSQLIFRKLFCAYRKMYSISYSFGASACRKDAKGE